VKIEMTAAVEPTVMKVRGLARQYGTVEDHSDCRAPMYRA